MRKREINIEQQELNMAALPELCYARIENYTAEDEVKIGVIKRGVSGYFPYSVGLTEMTPAQASEYCDRQNERLGLTPAQVKAMLFGSMFGWDTPGAHPDAVVNQSREIA
jgi:hypothetical protein